MSIAITGASGQLGGAVATRLLDVVDAADVVLMSRTVESLYDFAARGASVRPADEAYVEALVGSGLAKDAAHFNASFGQAVREGYLADVTTAVLDLTGRRPTSLEVFLRPVDS